MLAETLCKIAIVVSGTSKDPELAKIMQNNKNIITGFLTSRQFSIIHVDALSVETIKLTIQNAAKDIVRLGTGSIKSPSLFVYFTGHAACGASKDMDETHFKVRYDDKLPFCKIGDWIEDELNENYDWKHRRKNIPFTTFVYDLYHDTRESPEITYLSRYSMERGKYANCCNRSVFFGSAWYPSGKSYTKIFVDAVTRMCAHIPDTDEDSTTIYFKHRARRPYEPTVAQSIIEFFTEFNFTKNHWEEIINGSEPAGYDFLRQFRVKYYS